MIKCRFIYKNKLLAKQYFDNHGEIDSEFQSLTFSAFLIALNTGAIYLTFTIIFPEINRAIGSFSQITNLPDFVNFIVLYVLFLSFTKYICAKGEPEWEIITTRERSINKLYVLCSLLSLPVTYMLIYLFKWQ